MTAAGDPAGCTVGGRRTAARPLTARSVVLSLLLGAHPPELPVRDIVRAVELFDISRPRCGSRSSRMVGAGDLDRRDAPTGSTRRLLQRQARQDDATHPRTRAWARPLGDRRVTSVGRGAADRASCVPG